MLFVFFFQVALTVCEAPALKQVRPNTAADSVIDADHPASVRAPLACLLEIEMPNQVYVCIYLVLGGCPSPHHV